MNILCRVGWHSWEAEPSHKERIRSMGVLFSTMGIQKGIRRCLRCPAEQPCYRTGWVGIGGSSTRWRKMSKDREAHIDSRPVL